jgi:hypothetical protein
MKNDKEKFKTEFKRRMYQWTIELVKAIDKISKNTSAQIMAKQILRSGTSICANYIEAQCASSKKTLPISCIILSNPPMKANFGWR